MKKKIGRTEVAALPKGIGHRNWHMLLFFDVRLILQMLPLVFWHKSNPFLCKEVLQEMEIDD